MPNTGNLTGPTSAASFNREPLWWLAGAQGIVQAIFILLDSFHVGITSAQQAAITGLILVLSTAWGRSKVYAPINAQGQPVATTAPNPETAPPIPLAPPPPAANAAVDALEADLIRQMHERERKYGNLPPPIPVTPPKP